MAVSVPQIVYTNSWVGQTTALSGVSLFTPTTTGLFRITVYIEQTTSPSGAVNGKFTWADSTGSQSSPMFNSGNANIYSSTTIVAYATTSTAISLTTTISGSPSYNLYVEIEAL